MNRKGLVAAVLCGAIFGCSSESDVDIGDGRSGERLSDYASVWVGYAEAHEFADGSDRVRITLDSEGNGALIVGDASEPVADAEHPPVPGADGLVPGFPYTIKAASVADSRLSFRAQPNESFTPFCELQSPVLFDPAVPDNYRCLPALGRGWDGMGTCWVQGEGPREYLDCGFIDACWNVCECTSASCTITDIPGTDPRALDFARVDGSLSDGGDVLVGTFVPTGDERLTVRLTRQ